MSRITSNTISTRGYVEPATQPSAHHIGSNITPGFKYPLTTPRLAERKALQLSQLGHGIATGRHITAEMLEERKLNLKLTNDLTTPFTKNLIIKRNFNAPVQNGTEFTDFATATRQHMTQLASTFAGRELFDALNRNLLGLPIQHKVYLGDVRREHGVGGACTVTLDPENASLRALTDGTVLAGKGSSVIVGHQTDASQRCGDPKHASPLTHNKTIKDLEKTSMPDAVVLGHELIHAAHSLQGLRDPWLRINGLDAEEANTVGPTNGQRSFTNIPTENNLRKDLSEQYYGDSKQIGAIPVRATYSGVEVK